MLIFIFYAIGTLLELLQAFDEDDIEKDDLISTLRKLGDQCAFTEI